MATENTKELRAYEQIKKDLLSHEYEPGSQMVERTLSEKYNVSRSPIRAALRLLVKDGLLKVDSAGKIVVPEYTVEDILEIYDLMEVLQDYAVRILMKQNQKGVMEKLKEILEKIEENSKNNNLKERMEFDDAFHYHIINSANNKRLSEIFEILVSQKKMFDFNSFDDSQHGEITTGQHKRIYEAIASGDVDKTLDAIREHEQYIKRYYIDRLILSRYSL